MTTEDFRTAVWPRHRAKLEAIEASLLSELERAWEAVDAALEPGGPPLGAPEPTLQSHRDLRLRVTDKHLGSLLAEWSHLGPDRRALEAMAACDASLAAWARGLPSPPPSSGGELAAWLMDLGFSSQRAWRYRFRRHPRTMALGVAAESAVARCAAARTAADGQFLAALARGLETVRWRWEVVVSDQDAGAAAVAPRPSGATADRLVTAIAEVRRSARDALERRREWLRQHLLPMLARTAARAWRRPNLVRAPDGEERAAAIAHWARQLRACRAALALERDVERAACELLQRWGSLLAELEEERDRLARELERMQAWATSIVEGAVVEDPGGPRVTLVPPAGRIAQALEDIASAADALPAEVTLPTRFETEPGRVVGRPARPRALWLEAYRESGAELVAAALRDAHAEHEQAMIDLVRARSVVLFSADAAADTPGALMAREGANNARTLLAARVAELRPLLTALEPRLLSAAQATVADGRGLLFRTGFALWRYRTRRRAERERRTLLETSTRAALGAAHSAFVAASALTLRTLVRIGWRSPRAAGPSEVMVRPMLPVEFTTEAAERNVPALYRHLFRDAPVEDQRFLTGRDRELEAVDEARRLWESGRAIAVAIVGERGSGKTSIVNGAMHGPLEGLPVLRGEFRKRMSSAAALRAHLAEMVKQDMPPDQLEAALRTERRVIVLEELERTFLRHIGHYGAVHELQRLIAATSEHVLWIVVLNQIAFRFLHAATGLGQRFSHRLNASSATCDDLRAAILFRHDLSGLRLQFETAAPARRHERLLARIRGRGADPEQAFFDTLAYSSGGVYRSAFSMWLSHCEALDGGVLSVRPLAGDDLAPVMAALTLEDLFTLVAILQHGSLTPAEHAIVFQRSEAASRAQIDELRTREVIEAEPNGSGYRVRPAAMLVVREALFRRNLL